MSGRVEQLELIGRACAWCPGAIPATARRDARYCSQSCRQAAHRFGRGAVARERASRPLRLAYADPPYPGLSKRHYGDHADYAGEVDHEALLEQLVTFDGWALSTSSTSLPAVLELARLAAFPDEVRVAAWFRGARFTRSAWPLSAWEPVVFAGGRQVVPERGVTRRVDAIVKHAKPRRTDVDRVIGAKPADFAYWLFDLLGALPGDDLADLFPGSRGIARAWDVYVSRSSTNHASQVCRRDASSTPGLDDASRSSPSDATAAA